MVEPGSNIIEFKIEKPDGDFLTFSIRKKSLYLHKLYDELIKVINTRDKTLLKLSSRLKTVMQDMNDEAKKPTAQKELEKLNDEYEKINNDKIDTSQYLLDGVENVLVNNGYEFDRDFWLKYVDPAIMRDMIERTLTKDMIKKKAEQTEK